MPTVVLILLFIAIWLLLRTVFIAISRQLFPKPGIRLSVKAAQWAESRFPEEVRPVAAYLGDLLCAHWGVELAQLEPHTRFVEDLGMDDLEPVELLMALEEDLHIKIPDEDAARMTQLSQLVEYLHRHLAAPVQLVVY